jgi:phospholipase C
MRGDCSFGAGDLPSKTLADYDALNTKIPIDHIVLVMQENRTFDSYFSSLTVPGQTIDGASPDATNPDPTKPGGTISRFHQTSYCFDNPAESWDEVHRELDDGKLDGFTTQSALDDPSLMNDPTGSRSMGYYDESDLPYYYALARAFTISDRHFASVLANTWTNRLYYMAGTSFGVTSNVFPPTKDPSGKPYPNIFTQLNAANVSWKFYSQGAPTAAIVAQTWIENMSHFATQQQFFVDAKAGNLASVTFVEGTDTLGGVSPDEDPPADMQVGEAMVASIVQAVTSSPQWPSTALFISYDEQGGLYDHVVPPEACVPDDIPPTLKAGDYVATYGQYGLRTPLIIVSPYARRGYVSHQVTDHTSILRFVAARFGLPAFTRRDANAEPPFDMFDFEHPDTSVPMLPEATIDQTKQAACAAAYPGSGGP